MRTSEAGLLLGLCAYSDTVLWKRIPARHVFCRTLQIVSCEGGELYFFCFKCFSKMGQQMLERKKEREGERWRRRRKKNSQGKLFALQCGPRGKWEREKKSGRDRGKRRCLLCMFWSFFFLTQHFLGQRTLWPLASALLKIQYLSVFSFKHFLQCLPSDLMLQTLF